MNKYLIVTILICFSLLACVGSEPPKLEFSDEASAPIAVEGVVLVPELAEPSPAPVTAQPQDVVLVSSPDEIVAVIPQQPDVLEELKAPEDLVVPESPQVVTDIVSTPEATMLDAPTTLVKVSQPLLENMVSGEALVSATSGDAEVVVSEEAPVDHSAYFSEILGESGVATVIAQPEIPQSLRPPGVPIPRPGRLPRKSTLEDDQKLLSSIPLPLQSTRRSQPPKLLPDPEPEPGVIYVVPFVSVMVPGEVDELIFDRFVDLLNERGESPGLKFVILKEGLRTVGFDWLSLRKYVTGEIYAYVEDSGCCNTDLRARARLTYFRPNQEDPEFRFEYPVEIFFDHDRSTIEVERVNLAENIAETLAAELFKALQN